MNGKTSSGATGLYKCVSGLEKIEKCNKVDLAREYGGLRKFVEKSDVTPPQHCKIQILRNAIKMYHNCRNSGMHEIEAAEKFYKHYPKERVVSYDKWKPTKGNDGCRPDPKKKPWKMCHKPGRKRKMSSKIVKDAKQLLKRNPKMNNASIAQHLNW